jgi:alkylation response protein AidB-like acyl-CoA dehydrogenase
MIDFGLDDDEREILAAVDGFLVGQAPIDRLNPAPTPTPNHDASILPKLGQLGYLGLGLPEADGGLGLPLAVELLVFREFGRHLLSPAVLGAVIGARVAAHHGDRKSVEAILDGRAGVGIAAPLRQGRGAPRLGEPFYLLEADGLGQCLTWGEYGASLIPLDDFAPPAELQGLDSTLSLSRSELSRTPTLEAVAGDEGEDIAGRADLLAAAMLVGSAEAARDSAVDYVKTREQFGQPIGAFQSVKHRCADMAVRATSAWSQTLYAGLEAQAMGRISPLQRHSAVALAVDAAVRNGAANIQNHGGIGFTGEHHPHLFLKRAHILDLLLGGLAARRRRILAAPAA